MLKEFVEPKYIPKFLDGDDAWEFDASTYYGKPSCSDEEALKYLVTMPYHSY